MWRAREEVIAMRTILLAGLASCASIVSAIAADVAPAYAPQPPAWDWTGFYVGANVGWAGSTDAVISVGTDSGASGLGTSLLRGGIPATINLNEAGFIGGGQIGYNWQVAPAWVVGIETDFQGTDAKGSNAFTFLGAPGILPVTTVFTRELDWVGTLRGRFGYLWFPSLLLYGTGGVAYGQHKIGTAAICPAWAPPCQSEGSTANQTSNTSAGWTLGTGAEWRFAPAWSVRAEYLYVEFGRFSNTISYAYPGNVSTLTNSVRERDNIVRFGVNYLFAY
jgi:outer membrane immunogenic protein